MWTYFFLALFSGATLAQTGVSDEAHFLLQDRSVDPKLKRSLDAATAVPVRKSGKLVVKEETWEGEKPRLVGQTSKSIDSSKRDQDTLQDTQMGGCKECFLKIQNLSDLCRFEVALRVRPIEKKRHRFIANISSVYRDGPKLSLEQNTSIRLHLAKTDEEPLAINKDLVRCSCPYLRPNTSYIVFGHQSRQHRGVVIVVRAHRFSSNYTVGNRTDTLLRNSAEACSRFEATRPTGATTQSDSTSPVSRGHMQTMQLNSTSSTTTTAAISATDLDRTDKGTSGN